MILTGPNLPVVSVLSQADAFVVASIVAAVPATIAAIAAWRSSRKVENKLNYELKPNAGNSLKDAVTRIETRQMVMKEVQENLYNKIDGIEDREAKLEVVTDQLAKEIEEIKRKLQDGEA